MANLYQILGVSPRASQQEIRSAFRKLARRYHPDVNPSATATEDFLRIANAYRVLNDRRLRSLYDRGTLIDHEEALRRQQQRQAMERQINAMVEEMLRKDREESQARQVAVTTFVSLFFSTFLVALVQPPIFELAGPVGRIICLLLFGLGVRELVRNVKSILEYYTFSEEVTISVLRGGELAQKPFTRGEALAFLIGGYLASLMLGLLIAHYTNYYLNRVLVGERAFLSLFLLPPIGVLIVARLRAAIEHPEL
jgi:hypothetical protein